MTLMDTEPVEMTRAYKKGAAWFVEGRVRRRGDWVPASFVASAVDVEHMSRDAFLAFACRQLPQVTHDKRWSPTGEVLV
jgi:hypothetical protein